MSTQDVAPAALPKPTIPNDVKLKMQRGRKAMMKDATKRRLCQRFRRGETYHYIDDKNVLQVQPTASSVDGTGKPQHRIRNRYDFIGPIVDAKVSVAMSRVPNYEADSATTDPASPGAASLSEKVLLYGYDKWRVRRAATKVVDLAIGGGGVGYALPYFDPNVGPYTDVEGRWVGRGEIKILTLSGNQVYSEPGVDFEDSGWYAIERARPIDEIKTIPGYIGGDLKADANTSDIPTDRETSDNLAMVTEFFERPCPKYPEGRCMTFAAGKPIVDHRLVDPTAVNLWGTYPLIDSDGTVIDEPLIHRLVFRVDPETDRDLGLTWQLIDFERTIQDCYNKLLEWKNRCLNPQMKAPVNSLIDRPNDVPGAVRYYRPMGPGMVPEWENVPTAWAGPLFQILDRAVSDMRSVAADDDFTADPNVAAATVNAVGQQNSGRWSSFLGDFAEWYSRVGRHCLLLVNRHYTEPRLLAIRGRWGPENIKDFMGAHLMGQTEVRVYPESLASRTRQQVQQELQWIQANWPGYIGPEVAIAAMHGGNAENLIESFELDLSRVNGIIQAILDGTVMDMPGRMETAAVIDPATGASVPVQKEVGSYMPSEVDSIPIWKKTFGDWMKTQEYQYLPPEMQAIAQQIWAAIKLQENQAQAQAMQAQQALAATQGLNNAAAPQTKGAPSQPGDGQSPPAQP